MYCTINSVKLRFSRSLDNTEGARYRGHFRTVTIDPVSTSAAIGGYPIDIGSLANDYGRFCSRTGGPASITNNDGRRREQEIPGDSSLHESPFAGVFFCTKSRTI